MYLLALMEQVVLFVDLEGGDSGRRVDVHPDCDVSVVRPNASREHRQSLESHNCVLKEKTRLAVTWYT